MNPTIETVKTTEELENFARIAAPGEVRRYHRGYLPIDRDYVIGNGRKAVHQIASAASNLEERGLVHLSQKRIDFHNYDYLVIRTAKAM